MSNSDLPGTGGDLARRVDGKDETDVEGHRLRNSEDADALKRGEDARQKVDGDDDVEGHRFRGGEDLYRQGPTTEGEFTRRGPGENPHGDR